MVQNSSAREFYHVGLGKVVATVLQALFYILFAALLDPESYGELSVILALAGTFATVSRFGLNWSIQVYQAKKNSTVSDQIKTLFIITTSAAALILLPIDALAAVMCVGMSFFIMNQQNLLGLRKYKKFMINSMIKSGLFFVIPIVLYFVLEIPGIVLGMAIASFIGSIPLFRDLKIRSFVNLKNYFKVLFQNYLIDLSGLSLMLDKLLIAYLFGLFVVGVYQFNLQILLALGALPGILGSYLISEESSGATHKKISYLVILASIGLAIGVIILSPFLVNEFFPKYSDGILALQILSLTIIPQSVGTIYGSKLLARESTKVGFVSLTSVGTLLILVAVIGSSYGLEGLSLAILFSTIISTVFFYVLYRIKDKQAFPENK